VRKIYKSFIDLGTDIYQAIKSKYLWILFGIYFIAFSSILRSGVSYVDDYGRAFEGYLGWTDWSRWTTELLAVLVHAGIPLTDISPLPQLFACFLASIAGIIIIKINIGSKPIEIFHVIAVSLTCLVPYYLGVIVYKFDSPYMTLSLLVCVIPFLVDSKENMVFYILVSIVCIVLMCTLYQAYSGVYPMLACMHFFMNISDKCENNTVDRKMVVINELKSVGASIVAYIIGTLIFFCFLMRGNSTNTFLANNLLPGAFLRYKNYFSYVVSDQNIIWIVLTAVLLLLFVIAYTLNSYFNKVIACAMAMLMLFFESILCFGAYLYIDEEAYDMRCMVGYTIFVGIIAIYVISSFQNVLSYLVVGALAWCYIVCSLTVGNVMDRQQTYLDYRIDLLAGDISEVDIMDNMNIKYIYIDGNIGLAPGIDKIIESKPIVERAVFSGLSEGYWGSYYLINYFGIPNAEAIYEKPIGIENAILKKETAYHKISTINDNVIVVELK